MSMKKEKHLPHPVELALTYEMMKKARPLPHPMEKTLNYLLQIIS